MAIYTPGVELLGVSTVSFYQTYQLYNILFIFAVRCTETRVETTPSPTPFGFCMRTVPIVTFEYMQERPSHSYVQLERYE